MGTPIYARKNLQDIEKQKTYERDGRRYVSNYIPGLGDVEEDITSDGAGVLAADKAKAQMRADIAEATARKNTVLALANADKQKALTEAAKQEWERKRMFDRPSDTNFSPGSVLASTNTGNTSAVSGQTEVPVNPIRTPGSVLSQYEERKTEQAPTNQQFGVLNQPGSWFYIKDGKKISGTPTPAFEHEANMTPDEMRATRAAAISRATTYADTRADKKAEIGIKQQEADTEKARVDKTYDAAIKTIEDNSARIKADIERENTRADAIIKKEQINGINKQLTDLNELYFYGKKNQMGAYDPLSEEERVLVQSRIDRLNDTLKSFSMPNKEKDAAIGKAIQEALSGKSETTAPETTETVEPSTVEDVGLSKEPTISSNPEDYTVDAWGNEAYLPSSIPKKVKPKKSEFTVNAWGDIVPEQKSKPVLAKSTVEKSEPQYFAKPYTVDEGGGIVFLPPVLNRPKNRKPIDYSRYMH